MFSGYKIQKQLIQRQRMVMNSYSLCPIINSFYFVKNLISPFTCTLDDCENIFNTLDKLNYTKNIKENRHHTKSVCIYATSCYLIAEYFKKEYEFIDQYMDGKQILFGIFQNDKDSDTMYRGFCGWEDELNAYRMYINLDLIPYFPASKTFTYIFDIAKHEAAHMFLHAYDPKVFALENNVHSEEFIEIISDVDNYFYNKNHLLAMINEGIPIIHKKM